MWSGRFLWTALLWAMVSLVATFASDLESTLRYDSTLYPYGTTTTNAKATKTPYYHDAPNLLADLDAFEAIYIQYHSCAMAPSVVSSQNDEDDDDEVEEDDYWYQGATLAVEPQVTFSLYGIAVDRRTSWWSTVAKKPTCSSTTFLNAFVTTTGFVAYATARGVSAVSSKGAALSSSCQGGTSVACTSASTARWSSSHASRFVVQQYSDSACRVPTAVTDDLDALNQALLDNACAPIYSADNADDVTLATLLSVSSSCSFGVCPDPHGLVAHRQHVSQSASSHSMTHFFASSRHRAVTAYVLWGVAASLLVASAWMALRHALKQSRLRTWRRRQRHHKQRQAVHAANATWKQPRPPEDDDDNPALNDAQSTTSAGSAVSRAVSHFLPPPIPPATSPTKRSLWDKARRKWSGWRGSGGNRLEWDASHSSSVELPRIYDDIEEPQSLSNGSDGPSHDVPNTSHDTPTLVRQESGDETLSSDRAVVRPVHWSTTGHDRHATATTDHGQEAEPTAHDASPEATRSAALTPHTVPLTTRHPEAVPPKGVWASVLDALLVSDAAPPAAAAAVSLESNHVALENTATERAMPTSVTSLPAIATPVKDDTETEPPAADTFMGSMMKTLFADSPSNAPAVPSRVDVTVDPPLAKAATESSESPPRAPTNLGPSDSDQSRRTVLGTGGAKENVSTIRANASSEVSEPKTPKKESPRSVLPTPDETSASPVDFMGSIMNALLVTHESTATARSAPGTTSPLPAVPANHPKDEAETAPAGTSHTFMGSMMKALFTDGSSDAPAMPSRDEASVHPPLAKAATESSVTESPPRAHTNRPVLGHGESERSRRTFLGMGGAKENLSKNRATTSSGAREPKTPPKKESQRSVPPTEHNRTIGSLTPSRTKQEMSASESQTVPQKSDVHVPSDDQPSVFTQIWSSLPSGVSAMVSQSGTVDKVDGTTAHNESIPGSRQSGALNANTAATSTVVSLKHSVSRLKKTHTSTATTRTSTVDELTPTRASDRLVGLISLSDAKDELTVTRGTSSPKVLKRSLTDEFGNQPFYTSAVMDATVRSSGAEATPFEKALFPLSDERSSRRAIDETYRDPVVSSSSQVEEPSNGVCFDPCGTDHTVYHEDSPERGWSPESLLCVSPDALCRSTPNQATENEMVQAPLLEDDSEDQIDIPRSHSTLPFDTLCHAEQSYESDLVTGSRSMSENRHESQWQSVWHESLGDCVNDGAVEGTSRSGYSRDLLQAGTDTLPGLALTVPPLTRRQHVPAGESLAPGRGAAPPRRAAEPPAPMETVRKPVGVRSFLSTLQRQRDTDVVPEGTAPPSHPSHDTGTADLRSYLLLRHGSNAQVVTALRQSRSRSRRRNESDQRVVSPDRSDAVNANVTVGPPHSQRPVPRRGRSIPRSETRHVEMQWNQNHAAPEAVDATTSLARRNTPRLNGPTPAGNESTDPAAPVVPPFGRHKPRSLILSRMLKGKKHKSSNGN